MVIMANSQNGWAVMDTASSPPGLNKSPFPGTNIVPVPGVRNGDVATVLHYVGSQFDKRVEKLVNPGCWGYAYRPIRGQTSGFSNHASATAIDLNAPKHPLGKANTFTPAQIKVIRQILSECEGVVRWGGVYARPDDMHFEINAGAVAVKRVADKLRGGNMADIDTLRIVASEIEGFGLNDTHAGKNDALLKGAWGDKPLEDYVRHAWKVSPARRESLINRIKELEAQQPPATVLKPGKYEVK